MTKKILFRQCLGQAFGLLMPVPSEPYPGDTDETPPPHDRAAHAGRILYWCLVAVAATFILSMQPVFAATVWDRFSSIMKDVYGKLVGISTIVAVTASAVALLVRMISRNQRAVDEASSWLKRIIVTWIILNMLGFIVAYLQPLVQGGGYTGP
jgi:hypothetical protein